MRLVIELEHNMNPDVAKLVVRDALADFLRVRNAGLFAEDKIEMQLSAQMYVEKRYAHMDTNFRLKKINNVIERCQIARKLRLLVDVE